MLFRVALVLIFILTSSLTADNTDSLQFTPPVKIPVQLSASFAEIRSDHFHSGIDIKTQGVTGHEVVAAAQGYVYRVSVSPGGFGKALYMRHPSGYTTVYGHLESFTPEIEEYVREAQYSMRSFTVNLFPPRDRFVFKQGETIALSGNTGSSAGPHLHFEVRLSESEKPLDPLSFGFGIKDNIKPVIESVVIYPAAPYTSVNGNSREVMMTAHGSGNSYSVRSDRPVNISGPAGFGITTYDLLNDSRNRCGVYSIELVIDGETSYLYQMDGFSFDETRYVNSHIDYRRKIRDNVTVQKLFVAPNDRLSANKVVRERGIFNFRDDTLHTVTITVTDSHRNSSVLTMKVKSESYNPANYTEAPVNGRLLQYDKAYRMSDDDVAVSFPANSFYDNIIFTYTRSAGNESLYSDIFTILDKYIPVHNSYKLSIKPAEIPSGLKDKMIIVSVDDKKGNSYIGGEWSGDFLTADVRSFGSFAVSIDTTPPVIKPVSFRSGADLSGRKNIRFTINDDLSGIAGYEAFIDDNWALLEYDPKNSLITHNFDERRTSKDSDHTLLLRITDNRANVTELKAAFRW